MTETTTAVPGERTPAGSAGPATARSTPVQRLAALGRAELTLLVRNRTALFVALLMPLMMIMGTKSMLDQVDLGRAGLSMAEAAAPGGIGMVLLLVVHMNLVSAYVARREELVLKRLRTGELADHEILAGTALPAAGVALAQIVLLVAAGVAMLDLRAPARPDLLILGVAAGVVTMAALAALTAAFTRTVETAQITIMPFFMVSAFGSGLFFPFEVMPERMAQVCEWLPLSGTMILVRAGWMGTAETADVVSAAATALAWAAVSVFAVKRWFRWEPRR
jgi:ABC-2 type transport system permease protein